MPRGHDFEPEYNAKLAAPASALVRCGGTCWRGVLEEAWSKIKGGVMSVLAYHITWTTCGTWLPGDARGWVKWGEAGVKAPDPERERAAQEYMGKRP